MKKGGRKNHAEGGPLLGYVSLAKQKIGVFIFFI